MSYLLIQEVTKQVTKNNPSSLRIRSVPFDTGCLCWECELISSKPLPISRVWDRTRVKIPQSSLTEIQLFFFLIKCLPGCYKLSIGFQSSEKVGFDSLSQCICCFYREMNHWRSLLHHFCWHLVLLFLMFENGFVLRTLEKERWCDKEMSPIEY